MPQKSPHEPEADVMGAVDVREDARRLAEVLEHNASKRHPDELERRARCPTSST